jgi:hypothetical protein
MKARACQNDEGGRRWALSSVLSTPGLTNLVVLLSFGAELFYEE